MALLAAHAFITCVHVHTGSGGMTLSQMADGAAVAVAVAQAASRRRPAGAPRLDIVDIGGGLPCRWRNQRASDGADGDGRGQFELYCQALARSAPALFDGSFKRVVTEFGATLHCEFGVFASVVEVTKPFTADDGVDGQVAMIHGGSDLFLRACYQPQLRAPFPVCWCRSRCWNRCRCRWRGGWAGWEVGVWAGRELPQLWPACLTARNGRVHAARPRCGRTPRGESARRRTTRRRR